MDINDLLKIKRTQIKMLTKRGYIIPAEEYNILTMNIQSFINYINNISKEGHVLNNTYILKNNPDDKLSVFYLQPEKSDNIKKDILTQNFISLLPSYDSKKYILILLGKLINIAEIQKYSVYHITIFTKYELLYDVSEHIYSEKIINKVNDNERKEILKKFKIGNLKRLAYNDPVVKYLGYEPGDILWCKNINYDERALVSEYVIPKVVVTDSIST